LAHWYRRVCAAQNGSALTWRKPPRVIGSDAGADAIAQKSERRIVERIVDVFFPSRSSVSSCSWRVLRPDNITRGPGFGAARSVPLSARATVEHALERQTLG
jgi:hypothetical protein